jgi:hypothetical protein
MLLPTLRQAVLEANLELVRRGLVLYTFGNASAVAREQGLIVIKPKVLKTNKVFLMVTGGNNVSKMPEGAGAIVQQLAESTGSIVAELRMVQLRDLGARDLQHAFDRACLQGRLEDEAVAVLPDPAVEKACERHRGERLLPSRTGSLHHGAADPTLSL